MRFKITGPKQNKITYYSDIRCDWIEDADFLPHEDFANFIPEDQARIREQTIKTESGYYPYPAE